MTQAVTAVQVDEVLGKRDELIVRERAPYNGGPPPELQRASLLTPNDLFFVRNHAPVPVVDPATYRLTVQGRVDRPLVLSLEDLARRFERTEITATLQCAGNRRQEMAAVAPLPGELPWGAEAISTAHWSGWRLAEVLTAAGAAESEALHVAFVGLDEVEREGRTFGFGGSIPLGKALASEVLLADRMNGEPLPPTHGSPLRVVVPGYIGARSVKWLSEIRVQNRSSENYFQARAYRLYPPGMTAENADPAAAFELGELSVTSLITAPAPGSEVAAGVVSVEGWAFAGGGRPVMRVDLSADGGRSWTVARLTEEGKPDGGSHGWAWRFFEAELVLEPGEREIVARAWDSAGNTQPRDPGELWNYKGYMNNAWGRVRVLCK